MQIAFCNLCVHTCASLILCLCQFSLFFVALLYADMQMKYNWMRQTWPRFVLSMYLKKKKKTWNVKQESQDLWKQKNVWLEVNPVLYRRKRTCTYKTLAFYATCHCLPPTHWTWAHVFPSPVGLCIHMCAADSVCVSYNHGLQTQSVSRYWTPELFWPPLPMCTILVSGLHVDVCKPRSPGHIPPAFRHSAPGFK